MFFLKVVVTRADNTAESTHPTRMVFVKIRKTDFRKCFFLLYCLNVFQTCQGDKVHDLNSNLVFFTADRQDAQGAGPSVRHHQARVRRQTGFHRRRK